MRSRAKALVIEKTEDWQGFLGELLQEEKYSVQMATSYDEGKEQLRVESNQGEPFRVVTISFMQDEQISEGKLLLDHLKRHYEAACIVVTGIPQIPVSLANEFVWYGVAGIFHKDDFDILQFRGCVRRISSPQTSATDSQQAKTRQLTELCAKLGSLDDTLASIREQFDRGRVDIGQYHALKKDYLEERHMLVSDLRRRLSSSTQFDGLEEALECLETDPRDNRRIITSLQTAALTHSWGNHILKRIERHQGPVISLIEMVLIELINEAT
jgi:hypothetical protein